MHDAPLSKQKTRTFRAVGAFAMCLLFFFAAGFYALENYLQVEARARAVEVAEQKARYIDRQLGHGLSVTYALAGLVKLGKGQVANFEQVAEEFLPHYPGVSSLQLAPAGVIRQIVPLRGNESAIGHNLLTDELRNKEVRLAIETHRLTLAGPLHLIQGGEAILGRLPVYLGPADTQFWGFVISMIGLQDLLKAIDLESLQVQGYAYQLWRRHPDTGSPQVFARSAGTLTENPVVIPLDVPNGRWFLSLAPVDGWVEGDRLALEIVVALLVTAVLSLAFIWHLRTRDRLQESEVRYRSLYESTPTMMHSIDGEGRIVSVSQAWLDTLGYRRGEVIGRKSADFLSEASRRHAVEVVLPEFFRTGRCTDIEYQMLARDGSTLDVLLSAYGERNESGRIIRSLAVIQDITERKQTELRLHRLLAEQKAMIENDLVGIVRVKERRIVWANPAFEKMLGYGPGELNDRPTRANYPDEAAYLAFGQAAYPVLAAGQVFHSQFEQRHKDGRTVWLDVSGALLGKDAAESLWAFVDISELKQALSRIARSEQRMELALAGADLGLWDWHLPSGEFTCNRRMIEMLGQDAETFTWNNKNYADLINLSDRAAVHRTLIAHVQGKTAMFEAEYRVRHQDEHWVWIMTRGRVVERDAAGRAVRMTGTNLDISQRKANEEMIRMREARLANLISSMQDLVIVFDAGGSVIEYFYPQEGRHPYRAEQDPRGGTYMESLPPEIAGRLVDALGEVLLDGKPRTLEYTLSIEGEALISVAILSPIFDDLTSFPCGFLAVVRDVTAERLAQQKIEHLGRRNSLLLESVGEGVFGVEQDGMTTFINSTALSLLGFAEAEVIGHPAHELFHHHRENGVPYPYADCPVFKTLQDGKHRHSDEEFFWRKDGSCFPVSVNVAPIVENGLSQGAVVIFQDITERRRAEEAIRHLAFYDPLTQLPNRRLLIDRLGHALAASQRSGVYGALFFIDLDNFKNLNDSLGHDVGDLLLQQVANRLLSGVREMDTVARLGGDEFVLLCEGLGSSAEEAMRFVEQIGQKVLFLLNQPYRLGEHQHRSTPSIGVALFAGHGKTTDELLKEADIAMYQAKAAGRNTLRVFR